MVPKRTLAPLRLRDEEECTEIDMQLGGTTTVFNVLEAEKRLQGGGHLLSIMDLYGKLPEGYDITQGAVAGTLELQHRQRRQKKVFEPKKIMVTVVLKQADGNTEEHMMETMSGIFVFEVMQNIPGLQRIYYKQIFDNEGNEWRLDERICQNVTFVQYHLHHEICAWGAVGPCEKGLGNECIDKWAKRMLSEMDQFGLRT